MTAYKRLNKKATIIGGFEVKEGRIHPKTKKHLPDVPYHKLQEGDEVTIIALRREEYIVDYKGAKQHVKRRFLKFG